MGAKPDIKGNKEADRLADRAAEMAELPEWLVGVVSWGGFSWGGFSWGGFSGGGSTAQY